jgi:lipid-binding SYLF domain-containing protein
MFVIVAHRLTYTGLFAGLSLEGTVLIERKDANKEFYGSPVPARDILGGRVPPPEVASRLYEIIEAAEVRCASFVVLPIIMLPVASHR